MKNKSTCRNSPCAHCRTFWTVKCCNWSGGTFQDLQMETQLHPEESSKRSPTQLEQSSSPTLSIPFWKRPCLDSAESTSYSKTLWKWLWRGGKSISLKVRQVNSRSGGNWFTWSWLLNLEDEDGYFHSYCCAGGSSGDFKYWWVIAFVFSQQGWTKPSFLILLFRTIKYHFKFVCHFLVIPQLLF